jgi:hypothetical protein
VASLVLFGLLRGLGAVYFIGVAAVAAPPGLWRPCPRGWTTGGTRFFASYSANQVVSVVLLVAALGEFLP